MEISKSSCGVIALCAALPSCDRKTSETPGASTIQRANAVLSARKLPTLPEGVTIPQCWTGGVFAKYMNVKCTASPDQALDFLRRAGAGCYVEFRVEGKNSRIVANHVLAGTPESITTVNLSLLAQGIGMRTQPWFKSVYGIRHGWYYEDEGVTGYDVFYDLDNQQLYIFWHYS
jgi:hypothetical protein